MDFILANIKKVSLILSNVFIIIFNLASIAFNKQNFPF